MKGKEVKVASLKRGAHTGIEEEAREAREKREDARRRRRSRRKTKREGERK